MKNIYIHIGNNRILKTKSIIGVFDMDTATLMKTTRDYLSNCEKTGKIENVFDDLPRAFVVSGDKTYISQLSSRAIVRRSENKKIF